MVVECINVPWKEDVVDRNVNGAHIKNLVKKTIIVLRKKKFLVCLRPKEVLDN